MLLQSHRILYNPHVAMRRIAQYERVLSPSPVKSRKKNYFSTTTVEHSSNLSGDRCIDHQDFISNSILAIFLNRPIVSVNISSILLLDTLYSRFFLKCDAINQAACDILKEVADPDVYICGGKYLQFPLDKIPKFQM